MAFRHTLFWHIGDASAVGNANTRHKPKCYALTTEWLFEQESFHREECPDDDRAFGSGEVGMRGDQPPQIPGEDGSRGAAAAGRDAPNEVVDQKLVS